MPEARSDGSLVAVAKCGCAVHNRSMAKNSRRSKVSSDGQKTDPVPFVAGSMVVVTLGNPRDKFWGMILALAAEGLSTAGIELASFEDLVVMVKDGEPFTPAVVFFPMYRIERIELDLPDGNLPSLSQRFSAKTGVDPAEILGRRGANASANRLAATPVHPSALRASLRAGVIRPGKDRA